MTKMNNKKTKFSDSFYNWTTYTGAAIAGLAVIIELLFFGIEFFVGSRNVYLGLFTYFLVPIFLIIGLILIPVGVYRKRRHIAQGLEVAHHTILHLDISKPTHRNGLFVFIVGTVMVLLLTTIGTYKTFQYTESIQFCGLVCHGVMKPEYTAYLRSPHARVKCVECHIGSGADSYMRSKMSGLRQVYKLATHSYPRPIDAPVRSMRPAAQICEECHWPGKSFHWLEVKRTYFPTEKSDIPNWNIRMLIRTGKDEGPGKGVHAHMYMDNDVYYVADDKKHQVISWVKSVNKQDGHETVYTSAKSPYKQKAPPAGKIKKMDCMDCHNRPAHHFEAPYVLVDKALFEGRVKADIPGIKTKIMELLSKKYTSADEAADTIRKELPAYYLKKDMAFYTARLADIKAAAQEAVVMYQTNFFPEMKSRWDEYPDNIGHLISPGCFRCHDGEHTDSTGKAVPHACTTCHIIIEQGPDQAMEKNIEGVGFRHPFNGDESWKEMLCSDCHSGN